MNTNDTRKEGLRILARLIAEKHSKTLQVKRVTDDNVDRHINNERFERKEKNEDILDD